MVTRLLVVLALAGVLAGCIVEEPGPEHHHHWWHPW